MFYSNFERFVAIWAIKLPLVTCFQNCPGNIWIFKILLQLRDAMPQNCVEGQILMRTFFSSTKNFFLIVRSKKNFRLWICAVILHNIGYFLFQISQIFFPFAVPIVYNEIELSEPQIFHNFFQKLIKQTQCFTNVSCTWSK